MSPSSTNFASRALSESTRTWASAFARMAVSFSSRTKVGNRNESASNSSSRFSRESHWKMRLSTSCTLVWYLATISKLLAWSMNSRALTRLPTWLTEKFPQRFATSALIMNFPRAATRVADVRLSSDCRVLLPGLWSSTVLYSRYLDKSVVATLLNWCRAPSKKVTDCCGVREGNTFTRLLPSAA